MVTEKILHYYAGNYTAKGFYSLYDTNYQGLKRIFLLNGKSKKIKSQLMKKLADQWEKKGYHLEFIHSSAGKDLLDGVIIPSLKIGFYDGTSPTFEVQTATTEVVHVDSALNSDYLNHRVKRIQSYEKKIDKACRSACKSFQKGLDVHDDLEAIYIDNMDFSKANQVAEDMKKHLYKNVESTGRTPHTKYRFLGASTPEGVVDHIPSITAGLKKRYFIKGRAGTGKSTFLKKQAAAAEELGFDVEIYHCGFDPESLDMVVVRELDFCLFDSTDPHEHFPEKENDEIIDLYEKTVTPGTDEKYAQNIHKFTHQYKSYMKRGIAHLHEAKQIHDKLEKIYLDAADDTTIHNMFETLDKQVEIQESHQSEVNAQEEENAYHTEE